MKKLLINILFCYCLLMFVGYNAYQHKTLEDLDQLNQSTNVKSKPLDDYIQYIGLHYTDLPNYFEQEYMGDILVDLYSNEVIEFAGVNGKAVLKYWTDGSIEVLNYPKDIISIIFWLPEEKTDESFQKIFNELVKQYGEYEDYDSFPEGAGKEKYHISYAWAEIDGKWLSLFCDQDENGLVTNIILEWQYKMNIE